MINHLISVVEGISEKVKLWEHTISETQTDIAEQEKLIAAPFAKQAELDKTIYDDSFIESDNFLMVVDTDYHNPLIKTIYKFNDIFETNMAIVKEMLINAKGNETGNREALRVSDVLFGEGYVEQYDFVDHRTYAGQDGRRKGSNRGQGSEKTVIREWRFEDQEQRRTNTLTDREVLAMAADKLAEGKLTDAERDTIEIFRKRTVNTVTVNEWLGSYGKLWR